MKRNPTFLLALLMLVALLLAGCAPAAAPAPSNMRSEADNMPASAPQEAADGYAEKAAVSNMTAGYSAEPAPRLVIRNASLSIVVKEPAATMDTIAKMAEEMGGYVVTSNLSKYTTSDGVELPKAQINVRVPAEKLTGALETIKSLVKNKDTDILSENVSGQDVTKEYTDQKSRLTNLENAEKQLQKILEEATKTEDVLAVYNQLVSIREQIEVTKGQIKYYEESAALSSISVTLSAEEAVKPLSIGGWQPVGVARDALQALINTLKFFGNAAIWLIIFFVPIGFVLYLFFLVLRFFFRKVFKPRPKKTQPAPPQAPQNPPAPPQA